MKNKLLYIILNLFIVFTVLCLIVSCGSSDVENKSQIEQLVEEGHEGHNHGAGEHGQTQEKTETNQQELDWCQEHSVPESQCTKCNSDLIADFKATGDWCGGHDLPESHCRLCNPEIVFPQEEALRKQSQANTEVNQQELDWCQEHSVPESQCTKCNSGLIADFKANGDWCGGHDLPESHCRLCNPEIIFPQEEALRKQLHDLSENEIEVSLFFRSNVETCATDGALIQFASANTVDRAGISVRSTHSSILSSVIDAPAETVFDESEASVVTTTVPALISRWLVFPGDEVKRGDVLAILLSPEITQLKSSLVSANSSYEVERKELERHQQLNESNLISDSDFDRQEAQTDQAYAELISAKGLLSSAGLNESDILEVIEHNNISNEYALRSSASGTVVERIAQLGSLLEAGEAFAMIANPRSMWIEANLTEEQLRYTGVGQQITFSSDGQGLNRIGGEIIWTSRFLDPHTRTGTVRAKITDPNHQLRAGEFGRAEIIVKDDLPVVLVPKDAVQWEGCCNVVFVKETNSRYRPRKIELLDVDGPYYQVTGNIYPGENVVVDGAFLLKTELKKTSIGAGCCGLEPTS